MLSLEKCKTILDRHDLTDEETEQIRTDLYAFAEVLVEKFRSQKDDKKNASKIH